MTRKCALTGKTVLAGNNVSHSNRKTRRRFLPNLKNLTYFSEALKQNISLRLSMNAVRSIEIKGGIDNFLLGAKSNKLTEEALKLKKKIKQATIK